MLVTGAAHAARALKQAKLTMEAVKVALDLTQKTLRAEERKYEAGAETVFFVQESQTELAQLELNLIRVDINYQVAVAQADHSTGELLANHLEQIQWPQKIITIFGLDRSNRAP